MLGHQQSHYRLHILTFFLQSFTGCQWFFIPVLDEITSFEMAAISLVAFEGQQNLTIITETNWVLQRWNTHYVYHAWLWAPLTDEWMLWYQRNEFHWVPAEVIEKQNTHTWSIVGAKIPLPWFSPNCGAFMQQNVTPMYFLITSFTHNSYKGIICLSSYASNSKLSQIFFLVYFALHLQS